MAENHALLESGESRTCNVEKSITRLTRGTFLLYVDLVMYMSISEVLVKTCWSNATTAKIWSLRNFCQFYARQKLEVNKIGSSATRPYVSLYSRSCEDLVISVVFIKTYKIHLETSLGYCLLRPENSTKKLFVIHLTRGITQSMQID